MKIKPITLSQYNTDHGADTAAPLYVLNRSKPVGQIAFNCQNDLGVTVPVLIPATFIPIDLTTMAPRENIVKSATFRRILTLKQLVIVRPEDAEKYLESPLARSEFNKINKLVNAVTAGDDDEEEIEMDTGNNGVTTRNKNRKNSQSNDFVSAMIDRANDDGETDETLQREFLTNALNLDADDLERLRKETNRPALTELILQAMEELEEEE